MTKTTRGPTVAFYEPEDHPWRIEWTDYITGERMSLDVEAGQGVVIGSAEPGSIVLHGVQTWTLMASEREGT